MASTATRFTINAFFYYLIPLRMLFYFFATPVSFEYIQNGNRLITRTNRFRKFVCKMIHVMLVVIAILRLVRALRGKKVKENLVKLYDIGQEIISVTTFLLWIYLCWAQKCNMITLLQKFHLYTCFHGDCSDIPPLKERLLLILVCFLNTPGMAALHLSNDVGFYPGKDLWLFLKTAGGRLFYCFYLKADLSPLGNEEMTAPIIFLSCFYVILEIYYWVFDSCNLILCYITCYVAPQISRQYFRFLRSNPNISMEEVRSSFRDVKGIFLVINKTFGNLNLLIFLSAFPYFGKYAMDIFDEDNWRFRLETGWYMLLFWLIFFSAAEAHSQFQKFPEYLFSNQARLLCSTPKCDLFLFMVEAVQSVRGIGLAGGHFFVINYRFMGTFMMTMLTFLIIILQSEGTKV